MTPDEKYIKHMAYVLRNIKERLLFASPGQKILYNLAPNVIVLGEDIPNYKDEIALLEQLHAQQVIQLGEPHYDADSYASGEEPIDGYFLNPMQRFDEVYQSWEEINDNPWIPERDKPTQKRKLLEGKYVPPTTPPIFTEDGLPNTKDHNIKSGGSLDGKKGWIEATPKNDNDPRKDEEKQTHQKKLEFDQAKSILFFADTEILVSKSANSDPHELLQTIFKDRHKIWNTDEILDDWQFDTERKTPKKKVYHAGKAVNRIVAQETKIKDFLDVNTKTVAINRKYLNS